MSRIKVVAAMLAASLASSAFAQAPVFFRGDEISREHIIYGSVDAVADSTVTINLGHAHGVQDEDRFAIVRYSAGRALPLGRIEVILAKPAYSIARYTGSYVPDIGDLVLIRAEDLNLWENGINRTDRLLLNTISRIESGSNYDTREIPPRLLDELGRDDEAQRLNRQPPSEFLTEEEVTSFTVRDADIAGTFRSLIVVGNEGELRAPESELAYGGSADLEDALALLVIRLRTLEFSMRMAENNQLGGMRDLRNSQVTEIERRLNMLVRQSRSMLVGNEPPPPPPEETDAGSP